MTLTTKGIVLRVIRYSDTQEIHTVFTEALGVISLMTRIQKRELIPPLFEGDFTLRKGKSFFQLIDARQTVSHGPIRDELHFIETAFKLLHYILKSQMQMKPAAALYHLFSAFLRQIPLVKNMEVLKGVFLAKLLFHEGHLDPDHPLLPILATLKSFKDFNELVVSNEELKEIEEIFDEIYGKSAVEQR
ncbi:MAG: DNA repair protein RecO [Chlamydiia bacterium]